MFEMSVDIPAMIKKSIYEQYKAYTPTAQKKRVEQQSTLKGMPHGSNVKRKVPTTSNKM